MTFLGLSILTFDMVWRSNNDYRSIHKFWVNASQFRPSLSPLTHSIPWNSLFSERARSWVSEKKKKQAERGSAPLLYFPSSTIKCKLQKTQIWKWGTADSQTFPRVELCGQILASVILGWLGRPPSLFLVENKVHVLEAGSLTFFYPVIQIFPNNLQHLYTQETLKVKDAGFQLFFLPAANE